MADAPWQGDACSFVEAFRAGERSPSEELAATYAAIEATDLNAFSHLHREQAEAAARNADLGKPFGGVPIGVKELERVEGWPDTHACVVYRDQIATYTGTNVARARDIGGAVLVGQTTASEFGGVNVTRTVLNGTTHNPWQHGRTPGRFLRRLPLPRSPAGSSRSAPAATVAVRSGSRPGSSAWSG